MNERWQQEGATRNRVLEHLRRSELTIVELAMRLGITDNAVRGHVLALQRDGLVEVASEDRATGGKPAQRYRLTILAEERFPKGYAAVLATLLATLEAAGGEELRDGVLSAAGRRLAVGDTVPADAGIEERLSRAAALLRSIGGVVVAERSEAGWVLRGEAACPLSAVVAARPEACGLATALVAELAGVPVVETCVKGERPRCRWLVPVGDEKQ